MRAITGLLAAAAVLGAPLSTQAQERPARTTPAATATADEPGRTAPSEQPGGGMRAARAQANRMGDGDIALAPVAEQAVRTHHTATIGGRPIAYEATAGTLTLRDDDGKPTGSMFYVAYVADHARGSNPRPVTFLYNGGPGSSSMWLHMGSLAPVRVQTSAPGPTTGAPFSVVGNADSLLDKSDLVFLDAIGTGLSRPLGDTKGATFWGVDQDIDAFARAVRRYITVNNRWNSPKYLFGESYGTPRSAGLVYALQQRGMQINGVVLLSSILNFGIRDSGYDQNLINFLPSYAATAWYHNRVANRPADLGAFVQESRLFARGPLTLALEKGHEIPAAELDSAARQMSRFTGLSVDYLKKSNLRVDLGRFRKELLRDQRKTIGRLDSRFMGDDIDAAGESPEYDPADVQVSGAYNAAINDYLANELDYHTDLDYRPNYYSAIGPAWDWKHREPGERRQSASANLGADLSAAMRQNPLLKVISLNGYYDMATPFGGTEYDLRHLELEAATRGNITFAYYPSGHMVYLSVDQLHAMKLDLAKWYDANGSR